MVDLARQKAPFREADLTHARLLEVLRYEPETGLFFWKIRTSKCIKVGDIAGSPINGYVEIGIDNCSYLAHRLAWFYVKGEWPELKIDHKDTKKSNNKWDNLREATHGQNVNNCGVRKNNTSGFKGVSFVKKKRKWHSRIMHEGTLYLLGYFDTPEDARRAYVKKCHELHGEFARAA